MKVECISTSDITATLYDARCNQVGDADLKIRQDARVLAAAMEEEAGRFRPFLTMSVSFLKNSFAKVSFQVHIAL